MSKQFKIFLVAVVVLFGVSIIAPEYGIEVSPTPLFQETNR